MRSILILILACTILGAADNEALLLEGIADSNNTEWPYEGGYSVTFTGDNPDLIITGYCKQGKIRHKAPVTFMIPAGHYAQFAFESGKKWVPMYPAITQAVAQQRDTIILTGDKNYTIHIPQNYDPKQ